MEKKKDKSLDVIKVKEKKSSHEIFKKWLSRTSYTVILLIIIIAAYIGINLLVEKANITDIDLTKDRIYSLTDASKKIAKSIDQEINIILVKMSEYESIVDFAHRYSKENENIKVKEINDINQYPDIAAKYNLTSNMYEIIVECGEKSKILTTDDLYTVDYSSNDEKNLIEEAMTNALLDVTTQSKPKIY